MDWITIFTALLSSIGGAGVLLLGAIFIGKKWVGARIEESVKHEYAKKLEEHKVYLQEQANIAIQQMKLKFQDAVDEKSADKILYNKFIDTLPSSGSIDFIDKFNIAGFFFKRKNLEQLNTFYYEWNDPEHNFLDKELELLRKQLHILVSDYLNYLALNTWCCKGNVEFASVPEEWEYEQPERFKITVDTLHDIAQKVVDAHRLLVSTARKKLKC